MRQEYNKDYRAREYDKFSNLEPQRERKKPSFLTLLLVGLLVLLGCSLGYDNIIKPYLEKSKEKTEEPVATSTQETEEPAFSENGEATAMDEDATVPEVREEPVQKSQPASAEQVSVTAAQEVPEPQPTVKPTAKPTERGVSVSSSGQSRGSVTSTPSYSEDYSGLSTSEILDRRTHANVVKQAQRAGVSTEGSTSEILDRITHANVVRQAKQAGVSTEGSTSEILDRITHANVVRQAKQAGVSAEGTTSEILDRITHANVVRQAKQAGVSTEGTTSEILDRITRKNLERLNR